MRITSAIAIGIFVSATSTLPARSSEVSSRPAEPQFCNIYLDTLCFSLAAGQQLSVSLPIDFMLYTMQLPGGGKVTIYNGYNPEDALANKKTRKCSTGMKIDRCEFADDGKTFDLIYDTGGMSVITHIHIDGLSEANRSAAKTLLDGFHACTPNGISMACSPYKPFDDTMLAGPMSPKKP